ncbi:glycosyltransferase family 4 protein [Gloeothece verrucosa]|uniref:Glycosyl transferase group 1 n=1 Tax=Gloeothece verrucosa (strain PCC 7822) TaxID=497965 RepID=E0U828_GLOV7|nr:glycosyltransferase family 1 protein [Gloeothece verrucosa]ADN17233.1 glycosyl transferase group 1 [Gloeothece verrucosa PCC 7822]
MKVLYEVSNLGIGYKDDKARTGVFRVIENVIDEILKLPDVEPRFISYMNFFEAALTRRYFEQQRPDLLNKMIELWNTSLDSNKVHLYLNILESIQTNQSRTIFNRAKRKIQSSFLSIIERLSVPNNFLEKIDIYHSFFYAFPSHYKIQAKARVMTIYDIIPLLMPDVFEKQLIKSFKKNLASIDINKDWVICISESTKRDFCELMKMSEERAFVTHLAASNNFYKQTNQEKIQIACQKYGIPKGKYILGLSTLEPRKNNQRLIKCYYQLLLEKSLEDIYLVLVGSKGWLYDEIFETVNSYPELKNKVIFTGYVDDEDLSSIYSGATLFVYPSLYEGFGLPPLEAMQCGVPVITSNTSSLPEVVGDAGIMINPKDEDALCQAILNLLNNSDLQKELSEKGLERAKIFNWEKCARETVEIYQKILS